MASEDMDIDSAIAEAMGFAGFGMQVKKRKHGDDDAFVGVEKQTTAPSTGVTASTSSSTGPRAAGSATQAAETADGKPSREALRQGVRNAKGDMVYFLPSFIEDPWKGLEPR